jgi:2,3-bisphosphoglycerate-dependent phosphoglycerate mutase
MKTIYFVRHGATASNELPFGERVFQLFETPLSELGVRQATLLAQRFKTIPAEVIITSEMERARQTAEIIAEASELPLISSPLFHEILRPSEIRGKSQLDPFAAEVFSKITEQFADSSKRFSDEENFFDLKARATHAITFLESRPEEHIGVVTHGAFLFAIITVMMSGTKSTPEEFLSLESFLYPSNTGITVCKFRRGRWRLWTWNDDAHLGEIV